MTDESYPAFNLRHPRFDQATFSGRLRHFLDVIDPRTLLVSESRLQGSIKLLDDYAAGKLGPNVTNKELWQAQKIKQAVIHPDTGEKIFAPFRMSGYVPFGTPTVVGLLWPYQTTATILFWQWLNQSHNACVNYANRNATKPVPTSRFVAGYVGAVGSACSIAVGLSVFVKKANTFTPSTKALIQRFVPFPAVACANICNVLLMRNNELSTGIDVTDKDGNVVGTSKLAARKAIMETALTRVVLPAPILILPPIIMTFLERNLLKKFPRWSFPVNVLVCTAAFGGALPVAIALFPQYSKISVAKVEPEVREKATEPYVYYNKGL